MIITVYFFFFSGFLQYFKDFGDIIKETISKSKLINSVQSARTVCLSLQQVRNRVLLSFYSSFWLSDFWLPTTRGVNLHWTPIRLWFTCQWFTSVMVGNKQQPPPTCWYNLKVTGGFQAQTVIWPAAEWLFEFESLSKWQIDVHVIHIFSRLYIKSGFPF